MVRTVPLPPKPELTAAEQRSQRGADNLLRVMEVLTGTPKYEEPTEAPEVTKYRYDGSHQLIVIEHTDGARSEYEYDALGRRVAKHHRQAGGARQTTLFMWDGDWMMQEVRSGRTSHEDRAVTYVPYPDHEGPLTRLAGGEVWHYVTDHLGTPQELYDEQREVVWAADLSAYGRTAQRLAHAVDNPIRFPGQYYDGESGLHYNRFRYYNPEVGRYISQDPIGLRGGINVYAYVKNPIVWIDPLGLQAMGPVLLGMGNLYRSDVAIPSVAITQNSNLASVLNNITNLPFPSDVLPPGQWVGVNFPWQEPQMYCASGYYEDDVFLNNMATDDSGLTCKARRKDLAQVFSVRGADKRKFTCTKKALR
ncbi:type VI secretion protein (fragment) [Burkholderia stabilis]|uniref:Type VI secretion protein n=1 Tax=Burkholderia stabilis TaxID=95485 RepID=A0AAJ5T749_9BURK